ncbi:hypothetical protein SB5439_04961 [Klebsiella variicola]|uniref:hypothetical protein n=1 Tax=Klebsiella variicola TaxID=244366 RepID=UPI00109D74B5|nr:hypothetical protein [Klebsiella variicola]VGQ11521.1 hypothetical protein SB5439_04961 [Klebsiella variicola]
MKKIIALAVIAAATFTAVNANAISEGYRKQLDREENAELQKAFAAHSNFSGVREYTGRNGRYVIEADKDCKIKTVNGFAPKSSSRLDSTMTVVNSAMGVTFLTAVTPTGCKYIYNHAGAVGFLEAK